MVRVMLFPMLSVLYFYVSTFRSMCVVQKMAVVCRSLISCFPGMSFRYFVNDFEMFQLPIILRAGIVFVFIFHMRCIC